MGDTQRGRRNTVTSDPSEKESSREDKDKGWKCDGCAVMCKEETDMLLTCEYCGNHRCIDCLKMTKTVYKNISGRADLPCSKCIQKSLECLKNTKSIEDKCADFIANFQQKVNERMGNIEKEVSAVKKTVDTMKDSIVNEIKESLQQTKEDSARHRATGGVENVEVIKQTANEIQSRLERKNNIVLYNVKEHEGNLKSECVEHDTSEIIKIGEEMGVTVEKTDIVSVKRIGKKGQKKIVAGTERIVPRILIASLSEEGKASVMKNAYKLQDSEEEYYKTIGIKHDMTREEREKDKELRDRAKELSTGYENFVYLVRGVPWDRKIVKIKKGRSRPREGGLSPA